MRYPSQEHKAVAKPYCLAHYTGYKGAILPLLLYGAPVWIESLEKECNKTMYNRVQRLMNIKIAKAFRTNPVKPSASSLV
jgi:hypothetical protein